MAAATISEKMVRDVRAIDQRWALLYEDRFGGYVGRLRLKSDPASPASHGLDDAGVFDERLVNGMGLAQRGPEIMSVPGNPVFLRNVWPLGMAANVTSVEVAASRVVRLVMIATLSPFLQRVWQKALDQLDGIRDALLREDAAGGAPPMIEIAGAHALNGLGRPRP